METAFSGTDSRAGPQVDLCLDLFDCETLGNGRVRPRLLEGFTTSEFYPYQISGSVGCILKLYGKIDAEKLLKATRQLNNPRADNIRKACDCLEDLLLHGCILADEVGFGKTKQALLVALVHTFLYDIDSKDHASKPVFLPNLLTVPPTLINQWLVEIRTQWPTFKPVISYSDHEFKDALALSTIPYSAMKEYPRLEALPSNLRYIFDKDDRRAISTIVVTSYETHKARTVTKKIRKIPGRPFKPARFDEKGRQIWKAKPRTEVYFVTNQTHVYSLHIGDEAQKVKNHTSGLWSTLYLQSYRKTLLATATPIHNTIKVSSSLSRGCPYVKSTFLMLY
jgi:SNF2 family DNA or RNA helicase